MNHQEIIELAHSCISLWNQNKYREAYNKYYSADAKKVEPISWGTFNSEVQGSESMADHEEWLTEEWLNINSVSIVDGPFIGGNGFSVVIKSDFTMKKNNERHIFREIGVFEVNQGKIVREEYMYDEAELEQVIKLNNQTK